jgi:hypothetical protein
MMAIAGCGGDDGGMPPGGGARVHEPATCASERDAPIRDGLGGFACIAVGADPTPATGEWPDVAGLPAPLLYVRPGVTGGDGTMASPFGTVAEALAETPAPMAIVLATGDHLLTASIEVTGTLVLVGAASAGGTTLIPPADMPGIDASGAGARLTVRDLAIEYRDPVTVDGGTGAAVLATGGAEVTLEDVVIRDALHGVRADGATVTARGLTVLRAASVGVWVTAGGHAVLERFAVRSGGRYGILAQNANVDLTRGHVAENERDGIALLGGIAGETHMIGEVTASFNGVTGMRVEGALAAAAFSLAAMEGTRVPDGTIGGDGLFVGNGASVTVDPGLSTDLVQGHGTAMVGNARTGILGAGAGTELTVTGVLLGSNEGPGAFLQTEVTVPRMGYARIEDNTVLGVGAASASVVEFPCDLFEGTRMGTIVTTDGTLELGDGLSIARNGDTRAMIQGSEFSDNARFGAVFSETMATMRDNRGSGNRWSMAAYTSSDVDLDPSNSIEAREASPSDTQATARGEVFLTAIPP